MNDQATKAAQAGINDDVTQPIGDDGAEPRFVEPVIGIARLAEGDIDARYGDEHRQESCHLVPADEAIIRLLSGVCKRHGIDPAPEGVPHGSDSTKMVTAGIPTVVFGPGNIIQAHALDEYVEIAQVTKAARMLVDAARQTKARA